MIAVLATLISAGVELKEAVRLANKAGGIVVGKLGTAALTFKNYLKERISHEKKLFFTWSGIGDNLVLMARGT